MRSFKIVAVVVGIALVSPTTIGCVQGESNSSISSIPRVSLASVEPSSNVMPSPSETDGTPTLHFGMSSPIEMPLGKYVNVIQQAQVAAQDALRQKAEVVNDRHQVLIAKCMKAAGFEYYPMPYSLEDPGSMPGVELNVPWLPDSREKVAKYGYGVLSKAEKDSDATVPSDAELKNLKYSESLSAKKLREYNFTLSGRDGYDESDKPDCFQSTEAEAGIVEQADNSWFEDLAVGIEQLFGIIVSDNPKEYPPLAGSLQANKDVVALHREWAKCMVTSSSSDLSVKLLESVGPVIPFNLARARTGESDSVPDNALELALADFDCRAQTDYVARFTEIQRDVEQKWIDANWAKLDKLMATWEQQSKTVR